MTYHTAPHSRALRRPYTITLGMHPGYETGVDAFAASWPRTRERAAVTAALGWMAGRAVTGRPYLTGNFQRGVLSYAWASGPLAETRAEHSLTFSGCASPEHHRDLGNGDIEAMLNELADAMGAALDQTRVYVSYRDDIWIRQANGKTTPRPAPVTNDAG